MITNVRSENGATPDAGRARVETERVPTVSVVIPAFNLADVIGATLRSVFDQTSMPDEVIVIDDGSSDSTVEEVSLWASRFPAGVITILKGAHRGPGAARNQGLFSATGDWVAFLDGDDLWDATKIAKVKSAIIQNPDVTFIAHDEYERDLHGEVTHKPLHRRFSPAIPLLAQLYRANFLSTSCIAIRRDVILAAGGMDESLPSGQDYDFWLKIARRGRLMFIPEPLETYVLRPHSITSQLLVRQQCMERIAFRHAPWLACEIGSVWAWTLRMRFIIATQKGLLQQAVRSGRIADAVRLILRGSLSLLRALILPIGRAE